MPTLPPSVPGMRLFQRVQRYLDHGVPILIGHAATRGVVESGRAIGVDVRRRAS